MSANDCKGTQTCEGSVNMELGFASNQEVDHSCWGRLRRIFASPEYELLGHAKAPSRQ